MKLKSKLPDIGVTIFTRMTALANEWNAINLSQGFPDFTEITVTSGATEALFTEKLCRI